MDGQAVWWWMCRRELVRGGGGGGIKQYLIYWFCYGCVMKHGRIKGMLDLDKKDLPRKRKDGNDGMDWTAGDALAFLRMHMFMITCREGRTSSREVEDR